MRGFLEAQAAASSRRWVDAMGTIRQAALDSSFSGGVNAFLGG